ncbi:hypothetical protein C8R44DRAFT_648249 [Mycena epipterygia]|nr:hypothetical protein C8R44DRAFT_648249 [Mycena epipterygia]
MAGEVIISVAYGINVLPVNDPYIAAAEEGTQSVFQAAIPGRFLVVRNLSAGGQPKHRNLHKNSRIRDLYRRLSSGKSASALPNLPHEHSCRSWPI